jgi:ribosome-associated heat shock protein Hsp15
MVRVDKWLWAVRIYKTRSLATDACRRGHVLVNGMPAKPSKEVKVDDQITVRKLPVLYNFIVKQAIENRISAKLVTSCLEDRTSLEELEKLKVKESFFIRRDRGTGRPTKKERRLLDDLEENLFE